MSNKISYTALSSNKAQTVVTLRTRFVEAYQIMHSKSQCHAYPADYQQELQRGIDCIGFKYLRGDFQRLKELTRITFFAE